MGTELLAAALIDDTAQAPTLVAARAIALERVAAYVPYDSAIFLAAPAESGTPVTINKPDARRLYGLFRTAPDHYRRDLGRGVAAAERGAYLDTEVYSFRERRELPFYREIVRPQGITSQLHATLELRGRALGSIYLCRHGRVGNFRARDLETMRRLVPTLALVQAAWTALEDGAPRGEPSPSHLLLTPRERAIAGHVARGLRNVEIARLSGTSPNTVRNQLARVYRKLDLSGRAALAAWAIRAGLAR